MRRAPSNQPVGRAAAMGAPASSFDASNAAFPCGTRPAPVTKAVATAVRGPAPRAPAPAAAVAPAAAAGPARAQSSQPTSQRTISHQRYDAHKCADPFATSAKKCKTTFSQSYVQGNIPCRLQSSAARYSLQWDAYAAEGFSPDLLLVCADGLRETVHPFVLMAPMMFEELLRRAQAAAEQMLAPIVGPVTEHVRAALLDPATVAVGLRALQLLVQAVGPLLLPQLPKLVPVLARPLRDKKLQDAVMGVFGMLEAACGAEATRLIKAKIPTY
jgi:hypothetical protein